MVSSTLDGPKRNKLIQFGLTDAQVWFGIPCASKASHTLNISWGINIRLITPISCNPQRVKKLIKLGNRNFVRVIDGVGHYIAEFGGTYLTLSLHKICVMGSQPVHKTTLSERFMYHFGGGCKVILTKMVVLTQKRSGDPNPQYFSKSTAVQVGGVLPYKWEASCSTNGRRTAGFPFLRSLEARKARRYKWGAFLPYKLEVYS